MVPELPSEIWVKIASYIPDTDLRKLYGVNRPFHDLAMNIRWKEFRVQFFDNKTMGRLYNARKPSVASRIRYFDIDLWAFHLLALSKHPHNGGRKNSIVRPLRSVVDCLRTFKSLAGLVQRLWRADPHSHISQTLLDSAKEMRNIENFKVHIYGKYLPGFQLSFLQTLWPRLSDRVDSLTLNIAGENLHLVFPIFHDLSRLQHLSLYLYNNESEWNASTGINLAKFLNNTAETLESLSLTSYSLEIIPELGLSFNSLTHFSKLKRIHLELIFTDATISDIAKFLNIHSEAIEELSLVPLVPKGLRVAPLSTLKLPITRKLHLSFKYPFSDHLPTFWSGNLSFDILNDLTICSSPYLRQHDVFLICQTLRRSGHGDQLRHFHLGIMSPSDLGLFDHLALSFPFLHTLSIRLIDNSSHPGISYALSSNLETFATRMENRQYPTWTLYDINIYIQNHSTAAELILPLYEAMKIVARSIPSIQSFCGSGHMDTPCTTVAYSWFLESYLFPFLFIVVHISWSNNMLNETMTLRSSKERYTSMKDPASHGHLPFENFINEKLKLRTIHRNKIHLSSKQSLDIDLRPIMI